MRNFIVALGVAMLLASPGYAATAAKCGKDSASILDVINRNHAKVPDLQVMETHDKASVAEGTKILNASPPPTHFTGDQLYFMMSPSQPTAYMFLVNRGCAVSFLEVPVQNLADLLKKVLGARGVSL